MENGELLKDIHEKVSLIQTQVAVIDEKVTANGKSVSDHESRLRSIEKKIYVVSGAAAVMGWLAGKVWK